MKREKKSLVIGLDLGGTNSVFGIVDRNGEVLATTYYQDTGFSSRWRRLMIIMCCLSIGARQNS